MCPWIKLQGNTNTDKFKPVVAVCFLLLFSSSRDALNGCLASAFPYDVSMILTLPMLFEIEKA